MNVIPHTFEEIASTAVKTMNMMGISVYPYRSKLLALHNIHKGKRAFVIGNGPSLNISDLGKLQNEITFASNKIYLLFPETEWRPTYYSVTDPIIAKNNADEIKELNLTKIYNQSVLPWLKDDTALFLREKHVPCFSRDEKHWFSKDVSKGTYMGWTVTYHMLQIAYWMGIREVYLLGLDYKYVFQEDAHGVTKNETVAPKVQNHFHPSYYRSGETWWVPRLDLCKLAYTQARRAFEEENGTILNASRSTELDVFDRVSFDEVL